jgi:hypothetical protein
MSQVKGITVKLNLNNAMHALVLIRIGQDLGADSPAARAVHDFIEMLVAVASSFCR